MPPALLPRNLFLDSLFNLQLAFDIKDIRDLPRRHVREVAVALIGNDAFQSDSNPQLVIHGRKGQHFDLIEIRNPRS